MLGTQEYPTLKELLKARKKDLGLKVLYSTAVHLSWSGSLRLSFLEAKLYSFLANAQRALMGSKYAQLFVAHDTHMGADYARLAD
jgi:hypothetical protein